LSVSHPATPEARLARLAPWLLSLLGLCHALLYAQIVPAWQGPDEPRHFEYVAQLARGITPAEPAALTLQREIIDSMTAQHFWDYGYSIVPYDPAQPPTTLDAIWPGYAHETHQPPLYYRLAAILVRVAGGRPLDVQLRWVRYFSALLCAGVVWLSWATARTLFPERPGLAAGIALFVALLPTHAFAYATVNNDNLAAFFVSAQVYVAARVLRYGLRWGELASLLLLTILALVTKRTGFIAPLLLVVTLLAPGWERLRQLWRDQRGRRAVWIGGGGMLTLLAGVLLAVAFARPLLSSLWGGFFHLPKDVLELAASGSYAQALVKTPYLYYSRIVFESFWARFGWLNVRLADSWYVVLAAVSGVAGLGLLSAFVRGWRRRFVLQPYQWRAIVVFAIMAVSAYALIMAKEVLYLSYTVGVVPQGRYLFPAIIPLATLFVFGLDAWVPAGRKRLAAWVGFLAFVLFGLMCLVAYVVPYYRA